MTRLTDNVVVSEFSELAHANADSSALGLLDTRSSFDVRSSISVIGDCDVPRSRFPSDPLCMAMAVSESWLSTVAMNDPKAALILSPSSPRASTSFAWIPKYTAGFETFPFL